MVGSLGPNASAPMGSGSEPRSLNQTGKESLFCMNQLPIKSLSSSHDAATPRFEAEAARGTY